MQSRFDEIAKVIASGLSRREVFRRVLGIAAGALFANFGLAGGASAQGPTPTGSPCCPRPRVCFLQPDPTHPNGQKTCCPPGTICVPAVPGTTFGECCPRASVIYQVNPGAPPVITGCCPSGLVFDPSTGHCVCPSGSVMINGACCPNGSVCPAGPPPSSPVCCPPGTVCLPTSAANHNPCCPQSQVCHGPAGGKVCCPNNTVCVNGKCRPCPVNTVFVNGTCCPRASYCPSPVASVPSLCCASGTVCVNVPGAVPECCPKAQTVFVNGSAVGCCPAGQVFDPNSPTLCGCPPGTAACVSSAGAPVCCPAGSFCVPDTAGNLVCCPKAQTVFSGNVAKGCCPDGLVFDPNSPTLCGCPPGTVMTQNGVCCAKQDVCQPIPGVPPICCSGRSKCTTMVNAAGVLVPVCVCPGHQHPCPTPTGVVCCNPRTICV